MAVGICHAQCEGRNRPASGKLQRVVRRTGCKLKEVDITEPNERSYRAWVTTASDIQMYQSIPRDRYTARCGLTAAIVWSDRLSRFVRICTRKIRYLVEVEPSA